MSGDLSKGQFTEQSKTVVKVFHEKTSFDF